MTTSTPTRTRGARRPICLAACLAAALAACASHPVARLAPRVEVHPVVSLTLTGVQALAGARDGPTARIAGELRLPAGGPQQAVAQLLTSVFRLPSP